MTDLKIVVEHLQGSRRGKRQVFQPNPRLRFGRHPDNEVAFDPHRDLDASTRHAELRQENGAWVLVDVGSSNGTFVNGERVTRVPIEQGTAIEVEFGLGGPFCRVFVGDPEAPPPTIARPPGAGPHKPGARTVAMMVHRAMEEAHEKHGVGRSTTFMRSMLDQALHRSTMRFKLAVAVFAVILLGTIAFLLVWNAREQAEARRRQEDLQAQLDEQQKAAELRKQADEEARKLAAEGPGPRIVRENRDAVFLLAYVDEDGTTDRAFCTGFAVGERHLATNAHCVVEIERLEREGRRVFAVRNGDPAKRLGVKDRAKHSGYTGSKVVVSRDVGVVELDASLGARVRLADEAALRNLTAGSRIFTYGFPGRLADPKRPEATLTEGVIGRITKFSGEVGDFGENLLVQHSAFTSGGTSGSPVFDASGAVIAVNAGGYVGQQQQIEVDPATNQMKVVDVGQSLAGYNYGIRIDALGSLMKAKGVTR
jgi:S1-C subfamily serine protease